MIKAVCMECGKDTLLEGWNFKCACGGQLDAVRDFSDVDSEKLKRTFMQRLALRHSTYASGVWRYKELIAPELPDGHIVTKYEGNTGMYEAESVTRFAGLRQVWLKAQSENPSGSFKDNGMTAAVSYGRSLGYTRFACTSTGNTSSSLAMYASFSGSRCVVLVPDRDIPDSKLLQTLAFGADIIRFPGTYDDGIRFLDLHARELGMYVCNSINPLRIEGQKSIIMEIAQDLNWSLPDWIILPGGALSNASALGKGLSELHTLGFIGKLPRVAVVQAEGASPFHQMVSLKKTIMEPEAAPRTRATALHIGNPPSWQKALRTLSLTNGTTVSVSDNEIMEAKAVIDRSGIGCEPASAAALAGLRRLVDQQVIDRAETAVCILTGNMLKDIDALREYHMDHLWGGGNAGKAVHSVSRLAMEEVTAICSLVPPAISLHTVPHEHVRS